MLVKKPVKRRESGTKISLNNQANHDSFKSGMKISNDTSLTGSRFSILEKDNVQSMQPMYEGHKS